MDYGYRSPQGQIWSCDSLETAKQATEEAPHMEVVARELGGEWEPVPMAEPAESTTRITLYVAMGAIAGSTQELVIEGDDVPDGWDSMTDEEKETALAPAMDAFLANELDYGWTEAD